MEALICKCCGGKIDPATMTCLYCDTAYVDEREQIRRIEQENRNIRNEMRIKELYEAAIKSMRDYQGITTPNEMRQKIGLEPVKDIPTENLLQKQEVNDKAKTVTAYDTTGRKIRSFFSIHHNARG